MNFETDRIDDCLSFMKQLKLKQQKLNGSRPGALCVMATGGGAYKYYDKIREALEVDVLREDEMECLIIGTFSGVPHASSFLINALQVSTSSSRRYLWRSSLILRHLQCTL
jgi:pantothenate kinase